MSTSPLAAVRESIESGRSRLRDAVARVAPAHRDLKPAADRWSVAEVLEHLSLVEGRIAMMIGSLLPSTPDSQVEEVGLAAVDRAALLNRSSPLAAPEMIQPTGELSAADAWSALEQTRAELLAVLTGAEGRDLSQIGRQHPVLGSLNGYQWLAAIGGHEERHAAQIDEIAAAFEHQS
jgi:hypothetical protein